ncbi:MAG TPA: hypothetical protein DEB06_03730, partial [Phycisphaerales bacterium]|nr:hypothetical protein [Phycisphaerales bacterium]
MLNALKSAVSALRRGLSLALALGVMWSGAALAQPLAPANGPRLTDPAWHALVHATLVPEPGKKIEDATIVLRDGRIVSVQAGGTPPPGARVWDCTGLTVYAGLIEPFFEVDSPRPDAKEVGAHWNTMVMAQRNALDAEGIDAKARKALREMGYTSALASPKGGVFRGTAAFVSLADEPDPSRPVASVRIPKAFHTVAFETVTG